MYVCVKMDTVTLQQWVCHFWTSTEGKTRTRIWIEMAEIGWSCRVDEQNKENGKGVELNFIGKRHTEWVRTRRSTQFTAPTKCTVLTLILLTWTIWQAPNNAQQMADGI